MRYLSICSGIESATVAWHPLGWHPVAFAEVDPFPCAVLHHHYGSARPLRMPDPDEPGIGAKEVRRRRAAIKGVAYLPETPTPNGVPNLGDFTQIQSSDLDAGIDLLVGGTPCQDFSVAGLRAGLDGARGNLTLEFLRLAQRLRPRWLVWENVPGVLSNNGGRDFGAILGGLAELRYGWAYRVLDAQFIRVDGYARAVPQRRRRVFVVGHLGDWRRAAAVLFERACLSGNSAPRRLAGQGTAPTLSARTKGGGGLGTDFDLDGGLVAHTLSAARGKASAHDHTLETYLPVAFGGNNQSGPIDVATAQTAHGGTGRMDFESETFVAHALRAEGFDASEDGTGRGTPIVPIAFDTTQITSGENRCNPQPGDPCHPIPAHGHAPAIAYQGSHHANAQEANSGALLRAVRDAIGEEALSQWGLGILDQLQPKEILQSALHGIELRPAPFTRRWVVDCALSREAGRTERAMLSMREAQREGRASQGRQPSEQLARELGAYLSELSQPGAQAERFMRDLWRASEGLGLLRQALSAVQAARRPAVCKNAAEVDLQVWGGGAREGAVGEELHAGETSWRVRRLIVEECEFLMGYPRGYTDVPYRRRNATPDGPRYKALGNSKAVNCIRWVGMRIAEVDAITERGAA